MVRAVGHRMRRVLDMPLTISQEIKSMYVLVTSTVRLTCIKRVIVITRIGNRNPHDLLKSRDLKFLGPDHLFNHSPPRYAPIRSIDPCPQLANSTLSERTRIFLGPILPHLPPPLNPPISDRFVCERKSTFFPLAVETRFTNLGHFPPPRQTDHR